MSPLIDQTVASVSDAIWSLGLALTTGEGDPDALSVCITMLRDVRRDLIEQQES